MAEAKKISRPGGKQRKKYLTTNNSRETKYSGKSESYYEKYLRATSWREIPPSKAMVEMLTRDMMEHVANPSVNKLRPFFLKRFLREQLVVELAQRFPEFAAAYETAKQIIGERREDLAVYKEFNTNPQAILPTLRHYSPDWRKTQDEQEQHEEKVGARVVVLEKFADEEVTYEELEAANEHKPTPEEVADEAFHAMNSVRKRYKKTKKMEQLKIEPLEVEALKVETLKRKKK